MWDFRCLFVCRCVCDRERNGDGGRSCFLIYSMKHNIKIRKRISYIFNISCNLHRQNDAPLTSMFNNSVGQYCSDNMGASWAGKATPLLTTCQMCDRQIVTHKDTWQSSLAPRRLQLPQKRQQKSASPPTASSVMLCSTKHRVGFPNLLMPVTTSMLQKPCTATAQLIHSYHPFACQSNVEYNLIWI